MMRIILFAVAGLLAGVGGGAGIAIMTAKPAAAVASDSAAVDSMNAAQHASAGHDSSAAPVHEDTTHSAAPADSVHVAAKPTTDDSAAHKPAAAPKQPAAVDSAKPTAHNAEAATVVAAARDGLVPVRIGRIFAAMPPRDAARVMEQLDDNDVRRILSALSEKQAAAIMALMPAARAAAISKATLKSPAPSGEPHP